MADIVAHRGYAQICPENTLVAFQTAVAAGVCHIELDVQLTKDHVPVVIHDASLMRTGDQAVNILESIWSDIATCCVGEKQRFGLAYHDATLPALADFVEFLQNAPKVTAFIEIKDESVDAFGGELVVERVLQVLAPVLAQCVVIAYNEQVLSVVRTMSQLKVGWVVTQYDEASQQLANDLMPDYIIANFQKIPDESTALWPGPWSWILYEMTEIDMANKWIARGVEYIETMQVGQLYTGLLDT